MKNLLLTFVFTGAFSLVTQSSNAQCEAMQLFKEGTETTMTHYDEKGKLTGSTKTTYQDLKTAGNQVSVAAVQSNYDKKGAISTSADFTMKCIDGLLYFDMKMFLPKQQADAYKDFEMTVEGADMETPLQLEVGKSLKDVNIKFTFKSKDAPLPAIKTEIFITERKVEAKETITTAAGTFECYKISEKAEFKTMFSVKSKTVSWFSPEIGTVKTETYKENGKMTGKSEMTGLIKK